MCTSLVISKIQRKHALAERREHIDTCKSLCEVMMNAEREKPAGRRHTTKQETDKQ